VEAPAQAAGVDCIDLLTGETLRSEMHGGRALFAVDRLLARCPLALLWVQVPPAG